MNNMTSRFINICIILTWLRPGGLSASWPVYQPRVMKELILRLHV